MNRGSISLAPATNLLTQERPGWIPPEIVGDWNPDPYAYQTEEESMPAGGLHGAKLAYIMELLRHLLEQRGLMLLMDVFMLYRDDNHVKRRIAPDLLLMPFRYPPPSAYDLDIEPPPMLVIEMTSPDSHVDDLVDKVNFYGELGISCYLVIDAITPANKVRRQIGLRLWRARREGMLEMTLDEDGGFELPEMGVRVLAEGQQLDFEDMETGEEIMDTTELNAALEAERRERLAERQARLAAEEEVAQLRAELKKQRRE